MKLMNWLKNWDKKYKGSGKKKRTAAQLKAFNAQRGVILSGAPGIGKTSAATLIAKSMGFQVVEFNASDKRSKKNMHTLADAVNSRVMTFGGKNTSSNTNAHKRVVIMDEVDGMSSGDRGGAAVRVYPFLSLLHIKNLTITHRHSRTSYEKVDHP